MGTLQNILGKLNDFFSGIAEKMDLPQFFRGNTLLVNNFFWVLFGVVLLIILVLVIVLVPGKKKKKKKGGVSAQSDAQTEIAPVETETPAAPVETAPVEDAPIEEYLPEDDAEEAPAETVAPAEEAAPVETVAPVEGSASIEESAPVEEKVAPVETVAPVEAVEPAATVESAEEEQKTLGKYEIVFEGGQYYFLLKANNAQLLLRSSGFSSERGALGGIETFKRIVETGEFKVDGDKNGNFRFTLRAPRSSVVYYGESYRSRQSAESAAQSAKRFAPTKIIKRVSLAEAGIEAQEKSYAFEMPALQEADYKDDGWFEIEERNGDYFFILKANNGQVLLVSPPFKTPKSAQGGIDTFRKIAETGAVTISEDKNGKFRFILRGAGNRSYTGEGYETRQRAEKSAVSMRSFAKKAAIRY